MNYCPFCGKKLDFVDTCVFKCVHEHKGVPDGKMVLLFITNTEYVSVSKLEDMK